MEAKCIGETNCKLATILGVLLQSNVRVTWQQILFSASTGQGNRGLSRKSVAKTEKNVLHNTYRICGVQQAFGCDKISRTWPDHSSCCFLGRFWQVPIELWHGNARHENCINFILQSRILDRIEEICFVIRICLWSKLSKVKICSI